MSKRPKWKHNVQRLTRRNVWKEFQTLTVLTPLCPVSRIMATQINLWMPDSVQTCNYFVFNSKEDRCALLYGRDWLKSNWSSLSLGISHRSKVLSRWIFSCQYTFVWYFCCNFQRSVESLSWTPAKWNAATDLRKMEEKSQLGSKILPQKLFLLPKLRRNATALLTGML